MAKQRYKTTKAMMETLRNGKKAALLEALRKGNTRRASCHMVGITEPTLWKWLREDLNLSKSVEKAEAEAEEYYLASIHRATEDTWQAGAWWLERRRPRDYSRTDRMMLLREMSKEVQQLDTATLEEIAYGKKAEELLGEGGTESPVGGEEERENTA